MVLKPLLCTNCGGKIEQRKKDEDRKRPYDIDKRIQILSHVILIPLLFVLSIIQLNVSVSIMAGEGDYLSFIGLLITSCIIDFFGCIYQTWR